MKKLFTLFALLAVFMGAKAEWVQDYKIDYSNNSGFPFYVMGYVPEWINGVMTDFGAMYKYVEVKDDAEETSDVIVTTQNGVQYYKIELSEPGWHQYFIPDATYMICLSNCKLEWRCVSNKCCWRIFR